MGFEIKNKIFTKVSLDNIIPEKIDENGWGAFTGEFQTNFLLPSYIGLGNGITRGFGTLFSLNNPSCLIPEMSKEKTEEYIEEEINEEDENITFVTIKDVPVINKRKKQKKLSEILSFQPPEESKIPEEDVYSPSNSLTLAKQVSASAS